MIVTDVILAVLAAGSLVLAAFVYVESGRRIQKLTDTYTEQIRRLVELHHAGQAASLQSIRAESEALERAKRRKEKSKPDRWEGNRPEDVDEQFYELNPTPRALMDGN